jgi:hypothetical protein
MPQSKLGRDELTDKPSGPGHLIGLGVAEVERFPVAHNPFSTSR